MVIRGAVLRLALRNLLRKRARTGLAVFGMAVALILVVGLISFSYGLRDLVNQTLRQVDGLVVVKRDAPHLVLSSLPAGMEAELEALPGVKLAVPEVWHAAITLDGELLLHRKGLDSPGLAVRGAPLEVTARLRRGGLFRHALVEGRYLEPGKPADGCLLSRKLSRQLAKPLGSTLVLPSCEPLEVIGLFETGSMVLDSTVVVPVEQARKMKSIGADVVSSYYLELEDPNTRIPLADQINAERKDIRAFSPEELGETIGDLLVKLDKMLLVIALLPLLGAAAAVLNTMMMSFSERVVEFGVLKATGWTRRDVLALVLVESLLIGLIGGVAGCVFGALATQAVGTYLAVRPVTPSWLYGVCMALSLGLGALGGAWPAVRAALLPPMEAIRRG